METHINPCPIDAPSPLIRHRATVKANCPNRRPCPHCAALRERLKACEGERDEARRKALIYKRECEWKRKNTDVLHEARQAIGDERDEWQAVARVLAEELNNWEVDGGWDADTWMVWAKAKAAA